MNAPLRIFAHPDGAPDWPAANAFACRAVLATLAAAPHTGAELERACSALGVHPFVTHHARRELERAGRIASRPCGRAKLWYLVGGVS